MDELTPEQWRIRMRELDNALFTPAFRGDPSQRPLVYGYVLGVRRYPTYIARCRRSLERYCWQQRLQLGTVFADQDIAVDALQRPGFAGLCDVLRLPDPYAAVLLHARQLSPEPTVAAELLHRIQLTGARVLVVHGQPPETHADLALRDGLHPSTELE
jgi:hypothetical protein